MAYNKAKEEYKWKQWKEKEERQLREFGMDEDSIQELRRSDWEEFKSDRRFYDHHSAFQGYPEREYLMMYRQDMKGVSELLDEISDERLFDVLLDADRRTLQILLLKIMGFSTVEIASRLMMSKKSIYCRIERLKKKIKKFL